MLELQILISRNNPIPCLFTFGNILAQLSYDFLNERKLDFGQFGNEFEFPVLGRFDADVLKSLKPKVDTYRLTIVV